MSVHQQFADDLALYALGALEGEERIALEDHLASCHDCGLELDRLRGDMALLALSTAGPKPPARARQRLLRTISQEPRTQAAVQTKRASWSFLPWLAAAALALVAGLLWQRNTALGHELADLQDRSRQQQAQLTKAREIVSTMTASDALRVTLVAAKTPPQPQGKAIYVKDRSSLIFLASNMPPLPAGKAYELWLIPKTGSPIPAGVFRPDARGSGTVVEPPLPAGAEPKAFAITVEPASGSAGPTTQPIMLGAGE
ncbi:MAG: anti-sigma factor [Acidobacteriales bacterium]|nr:anti-sigma factor [Terriglobales bacterium]